MNEGDEFLSVDDLIIPCVFAHDFVDFFFSGLIPYFLSNFMSEAISAQCSLLIKGPAIDSLHYIFSSLIDLPQSLLNLPHLECPILAPFFPRTIRVTDVLLMQFPGLEVGGGAGGECGLGWIWFGKGVGLVEGGGGEGVEVAI